jgi:peptidoglycan/xylan/chitin deacetylase (PgdA/CDA1 family)
VNHPEAVVPKVLQFHKVSPRFELGGTNNTPGQFESFLKLILDSGYSPVLPAQLAAGTVGRPIIISFDDGYRSLYDHALPILRRYRVPALVFLITDYIGRKNTWDLPVFGRREDHLDWPDIKTMKNAGIAFGSHTASHADLTRISPGQLQYELSHSRACIEREIGPIDSISFPFNRINESVKTAAGKAGYRFGFGGFSLNSYPMAIYKDAIYVTDNRHSLAVKLTERPRLCYRYERTKSMVINLFSMTTLLVRNYG